jgi:hypothetical protein
VLRRQLKAAADLAGLGLCDLTVLAEQNYLCRSAEEQLQADLVISGPRSKSLMCSVPCSASSNKSGKRKIARS